MDKGNEPLVHEEEEVGKITKSVLQTKLSNLALQIGYIGSVVAAATVLILIIRHCISKYAIEGKSFEVLLTLETLRCLYLADCDYFSRVFHILKRKVLISVLGPCCVQTVN